MSQAAGFWGRIDVLVNNAGKLWPYHFVESFPCIYIQVVDTPALSKKEGESNNLFCEAPLKHPSQDGLASYSVRAQRFRLDGRNTRWLALPESAQRLNFNIHWKSLSVEN
jgi:hypothetical protein